MYDIISLKVILSPDSIALFSYMDAVLQDAVPYDKQYPGHRRRERAQGLRFSIYRTARGQKAKVNWLLPR